jgi:hypothetical protein
MIQEAFEFARPRLVPLMTTTSFYRVDRTVHFYLLVMAIG